MSTFNYQTTAPSASLQLVQAMLGRQESTSSPLSFAPVKQTADIQNHEPEQVSDYLAIANYNLPRRWNKDLKAPSIKHSSARRYYPCDERNNQDSKVEIAVQPLTVSQEAVQHLRALLASRPALPKDEVICRRDELQKLEKVIGSAGDNQYRTNDPSWKPTFHLTHAYTTYVNGSTFLAVQGYFKGSDGHRDKEFLAYYRPAGKQTIQELHYAAPSSPADSYPRYLPQFKQSIQTLKLKSPHMEV